MRGLPRALIVAIVAAVLALTAALGGQSDEDGRALPGKDWPLVGGDWTSSRYSTLTAINTETVDNLGAAWVTRFNRGASSRATPVVKDGVMFTSAGAHVYAIDARTGDTVWTWPSDAEAVGQASEPLNSVAGVPIPSRHGVALGEGRVFVGLMDGRVAALGQDTGELVWIESIGSEPRRKGESVSGAPTYARGMVFAGLANGDWALRGRVVALNAKTGEKRWTFFTVPGPGEFGHDTWPQDTDAWMYGGGGVWLVGTVDPDLGMVYFVTGNAVPMFGGEIRQGDNLFTASVLALDMETGERRWHYQVVHHDLWDADIATPLVLYEAQVGGQPRKALAAMRADGYLFLFDRATGELLVPVEERSVPQDEFLYTAPTQPFPVGADSILPDCASWRDKVPPPFVLNCSGFTPPSLNQHTVVAPGVPIPRVRVTPMSYSPQTGYIYAQGIGLVGRARRISDDPWFQLIDAGGSAVTLPDGVGVIASIDTRTNKLVWKKEVPSALLGRSGPLTTAGGLMFRGAGDGNVEAYDARTGERVWTFQTGVPGARGSAVAYEVDGEQYVALSMRTQLWAFKLGGTIPERDAPAPELLAGGDFGRGAAGRLTEEIETATLQRVSFGGAVGNRYAVGEHAFNPLRARVKLGTRVMFVNNGRIPHTVAAQNGVWTTGTLAPARSFYVTFDEPGTFIYHCTDHPWANGQVTVEP